MPLPFGIKLKRTRRYTVSGKSCLVTRIQLLNSEFVELTLSVESTGQECLEAVAQRLELQEVSCFSLWYFNKQNQKRWIDLEKPLKKQLEKYGLESTAYFGVVFYVPDVSQLQQEITRYQYYLQLKKDVLEGRITCSIDQATHLAGLAVQADFGDFNHYDSQEFLEKLDLFPIGWIQDEIVLEEAMQKVALLYTKCRGLLAPEAEMLYMQEVEKMEGYGYESYHAKDSQGTDILIGTCLDGIVIKYKHSRQPVIFRWNDINSMNHNKSFFTLDLVNKEDTVQFQTEDMETSKYVCRMCLSRQKFYKMNEGCLQTPTTEISPVRYQPSTRISLANQAKGQTYMMPPPQMNYNGHYTSQDSQNGYFCQSQSSLDHSANEYNGQVCNESVYSAHSTSSLNNPQHYLQPSPMSSNPSITGNDILRSEYMPCYRRSSLIPPSYRATPDYETVMQQKKLGMGSSERQSHSMRNLNIGRSYAYSRPDPLVYSQPEIREQSQLTSQYHLHLNYSFHGPSPYQYPSDRRPVVGAVSVPELTNVQLQSHDYPAPNIMRTQVYCPPPPYSYPRPANSTPDLSHHHYVSSSNPDLVTRRVHHSVQMFQEDSLPVAHSLQEVGELLTTAQRGHMKKRNSIDIAGLAYSLECIRMKETAMCTSRNETSLPQVQASGSQLNVVLERTKSQNGKSTQDLLCRHKKSLSDATMLVHSSGEEDEFVDDNDCLIPQSQNSSGNSKQHVAMLNHTIVECPTAYLHEQALETPIPEALIHQSHSLQKPVTENLPKNNNNVYVLAEDDPQHGKESELVLSVSVSNLSSSRLIPKQTLSKKRPVSDEPSGKGNNPDGLPPLMWKLLEEHLEQGMEITQYEQLPKQHPHLECSIAQLPENGDRNRFQDILPYDDTRVELVPTKENNTGYINASHIKVTVGVEEKNYIASQGPLSSTCQDFWQMVWEQGVSIIAMVTAEEEGGRERSFRYWPRLGSRHNSVTYSRFRITTRFRTDSGCYATTGLKIKQLLTGQERTVWHLQYTDWPDHGCPEDIKGFLSYLEEIQSVRRHTNNTTDPKNHAPVLIHCSTGVGRTGVVILTEVMIACLEHNELMNVPTALNLMRQQRMMMVQTVLQYTFVYKVLIQFLKNSRLI
nr:tyrosine-protein phosphatase non-receptor type 21 [Paramormyrops kingsleyae]XP_023649629.1 tyrosine-protein phosphatase non-receptor type 21 [Paramormyrops kingsleyae]XP_023649630.1 tyrosine-protein phosphatase non-receptor type 21 [Paramormyrops kingsleyae]XP_023649631.1 tyrosine-protein phosphatase non-receptor type 21 [Paramormyrops kingsleyae]XP_023649632.1 tyrosine-protein phosphatase non-receptor type 21 [Paramormyrops kingsleyae]XP_023649633.1 tyrosine-protein phosphatase non-recepto